MKALLGCVIALTIALLWHHEGHFVTGYRLHRGHAGRFQGPSIALSMVSSPSRTRSSTFEAGSGKKSSSMNKSFDEKWELSLRKSIHRKQWEQAGEMLSVLSPGEFILPSGRNIVFVVSQTCTVGRSFAFIVPLLSMIGTNFEMDCEFEANENDVIPALDKLLTPLLKLLPLSRSKLEPS